MPISFSNNLFRITLKLGRSMVKRWHFCARREHSGDNLTCKHKSKSIQINYSDLIQNKKIKNLITYELFKLKKNQTILLYTNILENSLN